MIGIGISIPSFGSALPVGRPGAPQNLRAVPGDKQITLFWDELTANPAITKFVCRYRVTGSDEDWASLEVPGGQATSVVVPNLVNGTSYDFRVYAFNAEGSGDRASVLGVVPSS